jgi:hypothetical protein
MNWLSKQYNDFMSIRAKYDEDMMRTADPTVMNVIDHEIFPLIETQSDAFNKAIEEIQSLIKEVEDSYTFNPDVAYKNDGKIEAYKRALQIIIKIREGLYERSDLS